MDPLRSIDMERDGLSPAPASAGASNFEPGTTAGDGGSSGAPGAGGTSSGGAEGDPDAVANFCASVSNGCEPVRSSEHLPGRSLPPVQTTVVETVTPAEIYELFSAACGTCHRRDPSASNGHWSIKGPIDLIEGDGEGSIGVGQNAIDRIRSADPDEVMPPRRGGAGGVRPPDADTAALLETLEEWVAAGRDPGGLNREKTAEPPFFRDPEGVSEDLTNIGNCLPAPEMVGCAEGEARRLDAKFAAMRSYGDLPDRLEETDLFTFDAAALAQRRVIAYAPTYTLFSDGAKKMRHVRVPAGQSIRYNRQVRDFDIPENTRFYKTFLREVVGKDGRRSYRKIETRIIVVRPDRVEVDGSRTSRTLFGTYLWSLDEARAELVKDPYNDQTPFRDLLLRHVIDEELALANGFDPDTEAGIDAALGADDARRASGLAPTVDAGIDGARQLTRGYALPGRDRCVQCHMGSRTGVLTANGSVPNASFILGFNPYQVDRRPEDAGGVFDGPVGPDELTQLRRFIDYGLITGVELPVPGETTVFKLETSLEPDPAVASEARVAARYPRNDYELEAQGYMMGNCAFCHNPGGFPSVENPSLEAVLNFYPSLATNGGIFRFPLETFSPRTARGSTFDARFYYLSPSLFERDDGSAVEGGPTPKFFTGQGGRSVFVVAPWRSLLFRNVHTPFTYGHDGAIHPHMPLNVPGHDPRAAQIMGDWMLSIPAKLKPGARNAQSFLGHPPSDGNPAGTDQPWEEVSSEDPAFREYEEAARLRVEAFHSASIWPYEDYAARCPAGAVAHCTDAEEGPHAYIGALAFPVDTADVVAPEMRLPPRTEQPNDEDFLVAQRSDADGAPLGPAHVTLRQAELSDDERRLAVGFRDFIPDRPSWVARDLTSRPGEWVPRRSEWAELLSSAEAFVPPPLDLTDLPPNAIERARAEHEKRRSAARELYPLLSGFRIGEELRSFALSKGSEFAYGLWQEPRSNETVAGEGARCEVALAGARRVKDLDAGETPRWLVEYEAVLARLAEQGRLDAAVLRGLPDRLVYSQPPGEIFFELICSNCHGREADSESLLGTTMLELTGGRTRVANLRDGLFGAEGANRAAVFPGPSFPGETTETMAVRYLLWMGLGGTEAIIPQIVLNRVGATRPLGVDRISNPSVQATPNMLSNAVGFCQATLGIGPRRGAYLGFDHEIEGPGFPEYDARRNGSLDFGFTESPLVAVNGDAELWLKACALGNPPPIRVVELGPCGLRPTDNQCKNDAPRFVITGAYWPDIDGEWVFPNETRFGDHRARVVEGLRSDNLLPWCVKRPADAVGVGALEAAWRAGPHPSEAPPYCPTGLFQGYVDAAQNIEVHWLEVQPLSVPDPRRDAWATRGAMNVGASVFLYLDALSKGELVRKPAFDACALPGG